jgi:hypothetical protein
MEKGRSEVKEGEQDAEEAKSESQTKAESIFQLNVHQIEK